MYIGNRTDLMIDRSGIVVQSLKRRTIRSELNRGLGQGIYLT